MNPLQIISSITSQSSYNEIKVIISGIKFKVYIQNEYTKQFLDDISFYVHDGKAVYDKEYTVYQTLDDNKYNYLKEALSQQKFKMLTIYQSSKDVITKAKEFSIEDIFIYEIIESDCFVVNCGDVKYLIMSDATKEKERQLLRIMKEVAIRTCENNKGVIFHAASLKYRGNGIVLTGQKGAGKTTLLCKLLNIPSVDYIANDKVMITNQYDIVYLPLALHAGIGTVQNDSKLEHFIDTSALCRKQNTGLQDKKAASAYDKYSVTSKEISQIYSCNLLASAQLHLIIIPRMHIGEDFIEIKEMSNIDKYRIITENVLTPEDLMWPNPWVEPRTYAVKEMLQNTNTVIRSLVESIPIIAIDFGTHVKDEKILRIMDFICNENLRERKTEL